MVTVSFCCHSFTESGTVLSVGLVTLSTTLSFKKGLKHFKSMKVHLLGGKGRAALLFRG